MKNITGIILSAGFSSRMGRFKPLLEFEGISFLKLITNKMSSICSNIIIVTGHNSNQINDHMLSEYENINAGFNVIYNEDYELGMFSSIRKGVQSCKKREWILLHTVDQPNLPDNFYVEFSRQLDNEFDWIQPSYKGIKGHPILFNDQVCEIIIDADEKSNLRDITRKVELRKKIWECNFKAILDDIDDVNDYSNLIEGIK